MNRESRPSAEVLGVEIRGHALGHDAVRNILETLHDLVECILELAAEHGLHHEVEIGVKLDPEIGLVRAC